MLTTVLSSVIAGLVVAAILGLSRLRWLYLSLPKLSFFSRLSDGQVVSMTLMNQGFRTEEAVEIHLRPQGTYEILASSRNDVSLIHATSKLTVPRMARFERTTIVLLVEGGVWDRSWVTSVTSKDTTAKIVEGNDRQASPAQTVTACVIILLLSAVLFQCGSMLGKHDQRTLWETAESALSITTDVKPSRISWKGSLEGFPITIDRIARSGGSVEVTILAGNSGSEPYELSAEIKSAYDESLWSYSDRRFYNVLVLPGDSKRRSLIARLPLDAKQQVLFLEVTASASRTATATAEITF